MLNIQATGQLYGKTITLQQISKGEAKKLFKAGIEVYLQSSNMFPFGLWQSVCPIKLDTEQLNADIKHNEFSINLYSAQVEKFTKSNEDWSNNMIPDYQEKVNQYKSKIIDTNSQFNSVVNNYSYYNCDNERGKYIHFYKAI